MRSVPVTDDVPSHRVRTNFKGKLVEKPGDKLDTLYALIHASFEKYEHQKCLGTREYLGMHTVQPPVKKFGTIQWKSYKEVGELTAKFGAALRERGLVPCPEKATLDPITTPCSIAIFENTCAEWLIAAFGAFSQSIVVTTVYSTLGMDAVVDAVKDGVISAMLCNKTNLNALIQRINDMPTLKTIIYTNDSIAPDQKIEIPVPPSGVKIISFEDFIALADVAKYPPHAPKPSSMAVLMYTSGSTGKPKGVVITHAQIVAAIAAGIISLGIRAGDVYLGYLPLAHILELMAEFCMIAVGCVICYGTRAIFSLTLRYEYNCIYFVLFIVD